MRSFADPRPSVAQQSATPYPLPMHGCADTNGTGPRQASNPPVVDSSSSTQAGDAGARCPELSPVEQAITGQPSKAELQRIYLEVANGYVGRPR